MVTDAMWHPLLWKWFLLKPPDIERLTREDFDRLMAEARKAEAEHGDA